MVALRIGGAHPDLLWLLPITAALLDGPETGAIVGFWAGLAFDLVLPTPFGLSALVGCVLGYAVGTLTAAVDPRAAWLKPVAALAGSVAADMLFAVLGAILGQDQMVQIDFVRLVLVVGVSSVVLVLPVNRLMRWALAGESNRRSLVSAQADSRPLVKRTLRHPIRGDRLHPKPVDAPGAAPLVAHRRAASRACGRARASTSPPSSARPRRRSRGPNLRLRIVGVVVLVLFGVLVLRLWTLQVVEGKSYAAAVTRNQVRVVSVPAPRGEIVDRNGTVLVSNTPQEEILLSAVRGDSRTPPSSGMVAALVGETPEAGAGLGQQQPVQPLRAGARGDRRVGGDGAVPPDAPVASTPASAWRRWPSARYPQGGTTGDPGPRLRRATSRRATWPRTPTRATRRGARSGSSGIEAQYEPYLRGVAGRQALSVDASGNVVGTLSTTGAQDRRHRRAQHRHRAAAGGPERPAAADPDRPQDGRHRRRTVSRPRPTAPSS